MALLVLVRSVPFPIKFDRKQGHGTIHKRYSVQFSDLKLSSPILDAVRTEGYTLATPIQAQAIPLVLAGQGCSGLPQTGTGKTAAFAMPILHRLSAPGSTAAAARRPRCLVLCPTRELASQIAAAFSAYGKSLKLRHTTVFGGVNQRPQVDALAPRG